MEPSLAIVAAPFEGPLHGVVGGGGFEPRPRNCLGRTANPITPQEVLQEPRCALLPTSPLPLTALQPVLGVHIARVGAFAAIDQIPEATLTVDDVVAPTTVLLIVVVTTSYLVGAPITQNHVVAPQCVDVVSVLGAYDLLASLGA